MSTTQTRDQRRKANDEFLENTLFPEATDHRSVVFKNADFLNEGAPISYEDSIINELSAPNDLGYNLSDSGIDFSSHELPDENSERFEWFELGRTEFKRPRYIYPTKVR